MFGYNIENPSEWVVWFDLDDTLWDFSFNSKDTLREVYTHYRLDRFWSDCEQWISDYHSINDPLWVEYANGTISSEHLRFKRFYDSFLLGGMNREEAGTIANEADSFYLERLATRTRTTNGAHQLLERLTNRGFRLGILSNGFEKTQIKKLSSADLKKFFDFIVSSDTAGYNKPDPRIYRYAERLARVNADSCIMIGDNVSTDIEGASNAGWPYAICYLGEKKEAPKKINEAFISGRLQFTKNLDEIEL